MFSWYKQKDSIGQTFLGYERSLSLFLSWFNYLPWSRCLHWAASAKYFSAEVWANPSYDLSPWPRSGGAEHPHCSSCGKSCESSAPQTILKAVLHTSVLQNFSTEEIACGPLLSTHICICVHPVFHGVRPEGTWFKAPCRNAWATGRTCWLRHLRELCRPELEGRW